jgi:hypothetical protein
MAPENRNNYRLVDVARGNPVLQGRLVKWKIRDKYKNIFIDVKPEKPGVQEPTPYVAINKMNGDAFHLVKIASLLAAGNRIIGVEAPAILRFRKLNEFDIPIDMSVKLDRRIDIVTAGENPASAQWWEVKSLAYNTKRKGRTQNKKAFRRAFCTLDIVSIKHQCDELSEEQRVVLGEDAITAKVKANQFYTKEFFVDRAYAKADIPQVKNRIQWVFQDFYVDDMRSYTARSDKPRTYLVSTEKFAQCGVNKSTGGRCSNIYANGVNPLAEIRDKLVYGIRSKSKEAVKQVVAGTINLDSVDDVPGYLSDFAGQKNYIINSENSFDWLSQHSHLQTSVFCAIN